MPETFIIAQTGTKKYDELSLIMLIEPIIITYWFKFTGVAIRPELADWRTFFLTGPSD